MSLKVLIVRTFPDILNLDSYNVQEIGLAKALTCKGCECGVVLYNGKGKTREENYDFEREGKKYSFKIYRLKGICLFKNGFMPSVNKLIKEYDVIQVHEYDQILSWILYSQMKRPTVIYHGPYYHEYAKGYNLKCRVFDTLFFRWNRYDDVVTLTKSELAAEFLRTKGFKRVHTVGVGVDRDNFESGTGESLTCPLEPDNSKFRILYVGKIEERRNVYFLLEVFERLLQREENVQLVIVGNGEREYRDEFLKIIRPYLDNGSILYFQKATQKELALIYTRVDLFIFPSNYEIFGMVLLEAMYFGRPVISSMNGGASVLIRDGENGYIIKKFEKEEWEEKILKFKEDTELCRRMGNSAKRMIAEHFIWDILADKFLEAYKEASEIYDRK